MKRSTRLALLAVVALAAAGAAFLYVRSRVPPTPTRQAQLEEAAGLQPVKRAPNFALPDLDGQLHALSQWRGKVRLLNFWATWCGPCRKEIPALVALQKRFGDRGLEIIGIATDEPDTKTVKRFAKQYRINYPLLMDNNHAGDIARHLGFNLIGLPASVLIDDQGNIASRHLGPIEPRKVRKAVEKLLNGAKKATNDGDRAGK